MNGDKLVADLTYATDLGGVPSAPAVEKLRAI